MSNLIKRMVDNLLNNNGKGFDNVVMNNLQKNYDFDSRIIRPNCLTSLFLLDVNKSPKDAFMKIREDQEGYANKTTRAKVLADAISLEKCFNDKKLKKAKNTTLDNFIFGISFNKDNFKGKYGNSLFEGALLHVNENIPNEHFAVQLLSAITEAKTNATKKSDIEELLAIEERCKPLVYYALKKSCPFKKQSDLQNKVMSYFKNNNQSVFEGVDGDICLYTSEGAAYDYFRFLGTANIINTKLADKALINTDYVDVNDKNSLVYIDYAGRQRYLINKNHPEADDDKYRITDIIKNYCNLIKDGKATQNTKYISKALSLINYLVVNTKDEQKKFLQTALAFLILMNEENVDDPFDFIGIALANPISDILALSQTNQEELKDLFQNSYNIANKIYKEETGKDLSGIKAESDKVAADKITEPQDATVVTTFVASSSNATPDSTNTTYYTSNNKPTKPTMIVPNNPNNPIATPPSTTVQNNPNKPNVAPLPSTPVQDNPNKIIVAPLPSTPVQDNPNKIIVAPPKMIVPSNPSNPVVTPPKTIGKQAGRTNKKPSFVNNNVEYYGRLTAELIKTLSKDYDKLTKLQGKARTKLEEKQYKTLTDRYINSESLSEQIGQLKIMKSDMSELKESMIKAIRNQESWVVDDSKKSEMFLNDEQDILNEERYKIYESYYNFIKNFDNTRKLKLSDLSELRKNDSAHPLNDILKFLPEKRKKSKATVKNADEDEKEEEKA